MKKDRYNQVQKDACVPTKNKISENKTKTKKQPNVVANIKNEISKNKSTGKKVVEKQQNITIIDITTDEPIVRRKNVIKKLPNLTAVKHKTEIKQNLVKTKSNEKIIAKKQLSTLDMNKIINFKTAEVQKRSKPNEDIIVFKHIPIIETKLIKPNPIKTRSNKAQQHTVGDNNGFKQITEKEIVSKSKEHNVKNTNTNYQNQASKETNNSKLETLDKIIKYDITNTFNQELQDNLIDQFDKNNDKIKRMPMRSSIRIAKKKSIESLSDSFTDKVNNKRDNNRERFSDKLKFMAMLQLKYEKNNHAVVDLDQFFECLVDEENVG
ncbi:unnamed protein product [Psylliodes chrysocephalus]|uniref:Uncharacterized protein n=1 Tax=Psylliodes chrysocephalus TaxID=3402493 RepID=A0A9P0CYE3_9CUCU|nr:unnamed protein product [Psylliodes chrysocephala]